MAIIDETDDKRIAAIERGKAAEALLADPAIKGAFDGLHQLAWHKILGADSPEASYRAAIFAQVLGQAKDALIVSVTSGVAAAAARMRDQEEALRQERYTTQVRDRRERARISREQFDRALEEEGAQK